MTSVFRHRRLRRDDAAALAAWIAREHPVPTRLSAQLDTIIADGLDRGALLGGGIDVQAAPGDPWQLDAFGLVGFLTPHAAARYLKAPPPFLGLTLFDHACSDGLDPWLFDYAGIAAANARDGLDMLIIVWIQSTFEYTTDHARSLLDFSYRSSTEILRGYRLRSVSLQGTPDNEAVMRASGLATVIYIPCDATTSGSPYKHAARLHAMLTAEEARASLPGAPFRNLFVYQPPTLALTREQQAVIDLALLDLSDEAISEQLGLNLSAVQKRWQRIYDKIIDRNPVLLDAASLLGDANVRGPEKRRGVLAYMRTHPEELRPYDWSA